VTNAGLGSEGDIRRRLTGSSQRPPAPAAVFAIHLTRYQSLADAVAYHSRTAYLVPMRSSRVPPPLWMLIVAAAMWALDHSWPVRTVIPEPWSRLGWCVMALAPLAPIAAIIQFRRAHTTVNPHKLETTTALVTSGVYAWTRNPMYLGLSILLLGWAIKLGTLTPFAGPLIFIPLIQYVQIRPEEHTLRTRFGRDYDQYCHRVNRWLGRRQH
jgi:protein-S-isoprenylcysteine O-methyltransferase Ste14